MKLAPAFSIQHLHEWFSRPLPLRMDTHGQSTPHNELLQMPVARLLTSGSTREFHLMALYLLAALKVFLWVSFESSRSPCRYARPTKCYCTMGKYACMRLLTPNLNSFVRSEGQHSTSRARAGCYCNGPLFLHRRCQGTGFAIYPTASGTREEKRYTSLQKWTLLSENAI